MNKEADWGMERGHNFNFRREVIKALRTGTISKVEAKECLRRGFGKEDIPIFYFEGSEKTPLLTYVDGLEKMGIIKPLIRLDGTFPE